MGRMTNLGSWGLHRRKLTWTLLFVLLMTTLTVGPTQAISRLKDSSSKLVDKIAAALTRFESARRVEDSFARGEWAPQGPAATGDGGSGAVSLSEASDDSELDADAATSTSAAAGTGSTDSQRQSPSTFSAPTGGRLTARRGTFGFDPSRHPNISAELGLPSLTLELFPLLGLPDEADIPILPPVHATPASGPASIATAGASGAPGAVGTLRADNAESPAPTFGESLKEGLDLNTQLELRQQSSLFTTLDAQEESQSTAAVGTGGVRALATPEPSTLALLSFGVAAAARLRRRRSHP